MQRLGRVDTVGEHRAGCAVQLVGEFVGRPDHQTARGVGAGHRRQLIERDAEDLDVYADLSIYGPDVEGVTEFKPGRKPAVKIASVLTEDERRENRLRTTLTHEWGHVHFHAYLWEVDPPPADLLRQQPNRDKVICKRDSMLDAAQTDWMEWQAG